ncbi:hypothetical protein ACFQL1_01385 [Halomicroarcula sp. GCM10025709]|uniref:hypothetical protein n=1 Tax=Haloarcula TaxID=2237 RepID=UPI0024C2437C|nr:hypothetical protein [Halomicroarcula sp. YJ-61-S]
MDGDPTPRSTVTCPDCGRRRRLCGDCTARREYRLGYATYREGRRRLTAGLDRYTDERWTDARAHIEAAADQFQTAVGHFTTAVGRAETDGITEPCELARQKATCLWQAMEWLSGATFASEQSAELLAAQFRHDGRERLQTAADYGTLAEPTALG